MHKTVEAPGKFRAVFKVKDDGSWNLNLFVLEHSYEGRCAVRALIPEVRKLDDLGWARELYTTAHYDGTGWGDAHALLIQQAEALAAAA